MTASTVVTELIIEGWPVEEKKLVNFFGAGAFADASRLRKLLLDADIRDYAVPFLADRINKERSEFRGPLITQLMKLRDVSHARCYGRETSHSDALIKVQLTDGHTNVQALFSEPIPKLSAELPPGSKLRLVGKIAIENGMILVNQTNCSVLGGSVQKLFEKWKLEWDCLDKPLRFVETNAPKWTPFSKQAAHAPLNSQTKSFRANDVINGMNKKTVSDNDDFTAARKLNIEQALDGNPVKKFARSQIRARTGNTSGPRPSTSNKERAVKKQNDTDVSKTGRSSKEDRKNLETAHKPSNPPTLFDFMRPKVEQVGFSDSGHQAFVPNVVEAGKHIRSDNADRNRRYNNFDRAPKPVSEPQQLFGACCNTSQSINRQNLHRLKKSSFRQNRAPAEQRRVSSDGIAQIGTEDYSALANACQDMAISDGNDSFARMHLTTSSSDNATSYQSSNKGVMDQAPINGDSAVEVDYGTKMANMLQGMVTYWKVGDKCLAPWSDGQYYCSTLIAMGPADMCTVEYDEYGNQSSVPVDVLLPPPSF